MPGVVAGQGGTGDQCERGKTCGDQVQEIVESRGGLPEPLELPSVPEHRVEGVRCAVEVRAREAELISLPSNAIARLGIALCPEERGIFASLNVEENLLLPPEVLPGGLTVAEIYELFPNLRDRLLSQGTKLSGGEQQMLAVARILRTGAKFLLLDEPTEGLAPVIVQQIGKTIHRLKAKGFTLILVEQNFQFGADIADRHYLMEHGRIVDMRPRSRLSASSAKLHEYLGV